MKFLLFRDGRSAFNFYICCKSGLFKSEQKQLHLILYMQILWHSFIWVRFCWRDFAKRFCKSVNLITSYVWKYTFLKNNIYLLKIDYIVVCLIVSDTLLTFYITFFRYNKFQYLLKSFHHHNKTGKTILLFFYWHSFFHETEFLTFLYFLSFHNILVWISFWKAKWNELK